MADLPSPSPGGFPNLPRSGNWFFRGLAFVKDVYDAMNRRRNRYDDRPAPDPQPPPPPPPPPSPSFGDDGAPGLEFREPVFAPVLKVTEADLSTPEPAPTPTPATTTTTTTGPTPIPATTTTTTTGPTPTLTPTTTTTTTTTTTGPRPAPSPTPATMTTTTTTSSPTLTSEPAQPIPAITTTAPPPAPISTTTTTDPDPTEISLLCRARNAILHLLPDGKRIATYLAFLLAASGVITVVWVLTRSSRTGGEQVPEAEAEPGLRYSLNDVGGSKHNGSVLNQLDCDDTAFCTYSLEELKMATDEFSPKRILSQDGEHAPNNIVYHGTIPSFGRVAIKRFGPNAWPDSNVFLKEARNVGCLRSRRIANLIGCCCENGERLIVAEFMPYQNLTETIHGNAKPMSWALRVQIALHLAQSLEYCKRNGRALYHKLNADKILFDAHGNTRLATFGLMKENSDDTGIVPVIDNTLVYSFGLILLALLKKKNVSLSKALDSMREKEFIPAMDSSLAGQAYTSDVIQLMQLAYSCLQDNAQEQPDLTKIVSILASFQIYDSVSDIGKAYASGKINELHDALESDAYSEDEMIGCKEPSELWSGQPVDIINAKNHGDSAFRSKQYSLVVKLYSLIVDSGAVDSPTVLARRSFASVVLGKLEEGLEDARKAGQISPDWPTAFYLQGMALIGLGKLEGHEKIKIGSVLEDKRSGRYEG